MSNTHNTIDIIKRVKKRRTSQFLQVSGAQCGRSIMDNMDGFSVNASFILPVSWQSDESLRNSFHNAMALLLHLVKLAGYLHFALNINSNIHFTWKHDSRLCSQSGSVVRSGLCYILADLRGSASVMCARRAVVLLEQLEDLGKIERKRVWRWCALMSTYPSANLYVCVFVCVKDEDRTVGP